VPRNAGTGEESDGELARVQASLAAAELAVTKLEGELAQTQAVAVADATAARVAAVEEVQREAEAAITGLRVQCEAVEAALVAEQGTSSSLQGKLEELQGELAEGGAEVAALEARLEALEVAKSEAERHAQCDWVTLKTEMETAESEATGEIAELQAQLERAGSPEGALSDEAAQLQARLEALEEAKSAAERCAEEEMALRADLEAAQAAVASRAAEDLAGALGEAEQLRAELAQVQALCEETPPPVRPSARGGAESPSSSGGRLSPSDSFNAEQMKAEMRALQSELAAEREATQQAMLGMQRAHSEEVHRPWALAPVYCVD
jgi:chromosome segregation ATPase